MGKAAGSAIGDVIVNALYERSDYTLEQALMDFAVGFVGDLSASAAGDLIDKYGAEVVARGLNKLGIDGNRIKQLTGIDLTTSGMCFTEETLIPTSEGYKRIKDIQVGDQVYSEDPGTGEKGLKDVTNLFVSETDTLLHVTVQDTVLKTTLFHPFYVVGIGWVAAEDLAVGDTLKLITGEEVEI